MNGQQFVDSYGELDKQYVKHKQEQYKNYKEPNLPYTEELFWNKLVHLGWRKDHTTTECLVLICSVCELSITKIILKDTFDVRGLLNVNEYKRHHQRYFCTETGKAEQE